MRPSSITINLSVALILMIASTSFCQGSAQGGTGSSDGSSGGRGQTSSSGKGTSGADSSSSSGANSKQGSQTDSAGASSQAYFESQFLSYVAVDHISERIAKDVCENDQIADDSNIFIYDPTTFANLQLVSGFQAQVELLVAAFKSFDALKDNKLIDFLKEDMETLAGVFSSIQATDAKPTQTERALTALGPYITASTADKSGQITLSDPALAINIARHIEDTAESQCHKGVSVYYPRLGLPSSDEKNIRPEIAKVMSNLFKLQRAAAKLVEEKENARPTPSAGQEGSGVKPQKEKKQGDADTNAPKPKPDENNKPDSTDPADAKKGLVVKTFDGADYQTLSAPNGLLNQILNYYTQPLPGAGVPAIASLAQGYELLNALRQDHAYLLFLEGTAAGGTQRIRKNLFTNLFSGDLIRYSGGAIVTYGLLDLGSGELIGGRTYRYVTPHTTIGRPAGAGNISGDNLQ